MSEINTVNYNSVFGNGTDSSKKTYSSSIDYKELLASIKTSDDDGDLSGLVSDYASISSGAYKKLVSAYYNKIASGNEEESETETANLKLVAGNSSSLKASSSALLNTDFSAEDTDPETALKNLKTFISDYNSLIDTADDVNSKSVLRNTLWMVNITDKISGLLSDVGITIGEDNKLSLNEDTWGKAENGLKGILFNGGNSYANKMLYKASQINTSSGGTSSGTYTSRGAYSTTNGASTIDTET
ncbi:MAG: hypothetical protein K6B75_03555 [Lachnospiraceae bacterium]|nr:hypothetical protein [Lachnospiraceae bacterium]